MATNTDPPATNQLSEEEIRRLSEAVLNVPISSFTSGGNYTASSLGVLLNSGSYPLRGVMLPSATSGYIHITPESEDTTVTSTVTTTTGTTSDETGTTWVYPNTYTVPWEDHTSGGTIRIGGGTTPFPGDFSQGVRIYPNPHTVEVETSPGTELLERIRRLSEVPREEESPVSEMIKKLHIGKDGQLTITVAGPKMASREAISPETIKKLDRELKAAVIRAFELVLDEAKIAEIRRTLIID